MTVRQLLTQADSYELTAWTAYFEVEAERQKDEADRRDFQQRLRQG